MSKLQSNTRPARRGVALHRLESRQLLSTSPAIVDGVLQIVGTAGADVISVALGRNGRVHASVNGATTQFKLGKVHGVSVEAGAGEDRVVVSLAVPTTLVGGAGDDVLVSSAGNDLLSGGKGYDQLFPGYGSDRVELGENSPAATPPADLLASLGSVTTLPALNLGASSALVTGGSATIDGNVNFDDLLKLAANYNTPSKDWYTGDFNADNAVNFDDLLTLAANYNQSLTGSLNGDWALALQTDLTSAVRDTRAALVVRDRFQVKSQVDVGRRRVRIDFALKTSPDAVAFSVVMRTKSLILFSAQDEVARVVGFDSRTLSKRLPTTGDAVIVGRSKAVRLTGSLADVAGSNAVALRAVGGDIVISRVAGEGATFVVA